MRCFSLCPYKRVHVSGNDVSGHGEHDHDGNTRENNNAAGDQREPSPPLPDNKVPVSQPPRRARDYNWKLAGATECSVSCGKGESDDFKMI